MANHGSVHIFVERVCEVSSRSSCWPLQRAPPFPRWLTLGPGRNAGASGSTVITCGAAVHCPHRDTIIIARRRVIGRRLTGIRGGQRASPRIVVSDTALTAYRSNRSKPLIGTSRSKYFYYFSMLAAGHWQDHGSRTFSSATLGIDRSFSRRFPNLHR